MNILVSFCSIGIAGRPLLGVFNTTTLAFHLLNTPQVLHGCTGVMGLAISKEYIYLAPQIPSLPQSLMIFDVNNFNLLCKYEYQNAEDVHSLWLDGDMLYTVSSGTDEIIALKICSTDIVSETVFWRPDPGLPRMDIHHLNAVYGYNGDIMVCGFGKKEQEHWSSANNGFIHNITKNKTITTELSHPHSLLMVDGSLVFCESANRIVHKTDKTSSTVLPGFPRGLCRIGDNLFVGMSKKRQISKSTGMNLNSNQPSGYGQCGLARLAVNTLETQEIIGLDDFASEIYDLVVVSDTAQWPLVSNAHFMSLGETWNKQTDLLIQDILTHTKPQECIVLVDESKLGIGPVLHGRACLPFPERDGVYWGLPAEDNDAIDEIERLRTKGAEYMVFAWPSLWWLDSYAGLRSHLCSHYRCLLQNERLVMYDLRR